jgi:hypothetical protein
MHGASCARAHLERRELFLQVLSLEPDADDVAVCDHVAREGFALLDEMEAADSTGKTVR